MEQEVKSALNEAAHSWDEKASAPDAAPASAAVQAPTSDVAPVPAAARGPEDFAPAPEDPARVSNAPVQLPPCPPSGYEVPRGQSRTAAPAVPADLPRPRRWRWLASLAGVVTVDLLIQIVFSAAGMLLLQLAAQAGALPQAQVDALLDDATVLVVLTQVVRIVAMSPWWRHMLRTTLVPQPQAVPPLDQRLRSVAGLVLLGLGLQFVLGLALTVILPLFPAIMDEYTELMDSAGAGPSATSLLSVLSVTVLAAVGEEIVCRGIMFEYALRAVSGFARLSSRPTIDPRMFWVANALQAAAFGLLHLNVVQSTYAFLLGMLMGWVYWKTGSLRYPIALHLSVNAASYVIEPISAALPGPVFLALLVACLIAGAKLFAMVWDAPQRQASPFARG